MFYRKEKGGSSTHLRSDGKSDNWAADLHERWRGRNRYEISA